MTVAMVAIPMACAVSALFNSSMMFIMSIILVTILGSSMMFSTANMVWVSFVMLMLIVGGMMILYVFILSMNSNETLEKKSNIMVIPLIILMLLPFTKNKTSKSKSDYMSMMFQNSSMSIMLMMSAILITMFLASSMIINPSNPLKSMK